jgi:3-methyladenine DNA glycosylase AlkC
MNHPAPPWTPCLPPAPRSIQKGVPLKHVLGDQAVEYLGRNVQSVYPAFDVQGFRTMALNGLEPLGILDRGHHVAQALWQHLPQRFSSATQVLLQSLTPPVDSTSELGLAVFFYLPHVSFVAQYGLDPAHNGGDDPFEAAMQAQYELTQRFSAEFSIRRFLIEQPERTLACLQKWTTDPSPHVRRLCSEGTRPRLPWAMRLPAFIKDPNPLMPLLEALKDDPDLYVRRSVANHLGDIAKDHPEWVYAVCERWLHNASSERKWLIRHALRHPAKKGDETALSLRNRSKS